MPRSSSNAGERRKTRRFFNLAALVYPLIERGLLPSYRYVLGQLDLDPGLTVLDLATGTGDLAIELARLNPQKITGVDIAANMLEIGKEKVAAKKLSNTIELLLGDSEDLPFENNSFDAVTVAFGVRNFEHLQKGLGEMYRVMRPGGMVAILEFSKPKAFPFRQIYNFYFKYILPGLGRMVSKNEEAYTYLPESVSAFPEDQAFINELKKAGYLEPRQRRLTMGIATLYTATKK